MPNVVTRRPSERPPGRRRQIPSPRGADRTKISSQNVRQGAVDRSPEIHVQRRDPSSATTWRTGPAFWRPRRGTGKQPLRTPLATRLARSGIVSWLARNREAVADAARTLRALSARNRRRGRAGRGRCDAARTCEPDRPSPAWRPVARDSSSVPWNPTVARPRPRGVRGLRPAGDHPSREIRPSPRPRPSSGRSSRLPRGSRVQALGSNRLGRPSPTEPTEYGSAIPV